MKTTTLKNLQKRSNGMEKHKSTLKPPLEIPKDLQNRVKLNPIVKTVKNC
jgi:hypothetical protein